MPITIAALCRVLNPQRTSLLLGAGASVPSGAPTGKTLAHLLWREIGASEPQSDDLTETASILERRAGRRVVVECVIRALSRLHPTGGLLTLPKFNWNSIYSTNFDRLVEESFKKMGVALPVIRSNYDFSAKEARSGICLYKIHGCISQDRSLGDKASMLLTEQDYEEFEKYRQSMFALLQASMLSGDVLVIGQSLRDKHLADLVKRVLSYKEQGAPGQVYVVVYERDDLRAPLLEDRGAKIAFAGIDEFTNELTSGASALNALSDLATTGTLPLSLISSVLDVTHACELVPNVTKMFNGSSASYADIRAGATFERAQFSSVLDEISRAGRVSVSIIGAAGVGKTTFARQIAFRLREEGVEAYEHRVDFPFISENWIQFECDLRQKGRRAVLLLDECTHYLRQVNLLVEHLASVESPALVVVLTANAAQWSPRLKSAKLFSRGVVHTLSQLEAPELYSLVNLVENNRTIGALVQSDFKSLNRQGQFARLKERCSADMFVCLKNIFANDSLDQILLVEYEELPDFAQQHYRYIAALESVGMRVHRQLVMRMLHLQADQVAAMLASLSGIVEEFTIKEREGVFGWSTRHIVIARKITEYKFSSEDELKDLFDKIIENINPAVPVELRSVRDICDTEFGIGRLTNSTLRRQLYRRLIEIAPGERIPWHRLIRELLESGELEEVEYLIRDATKAVGSDAPIDRYKVRLLMARAEQTVGISEKDKTAIVRRAFEVAERNVAHHRFDKHSYSTLCSVALKLIDRGDSPHLLDQAIAKMREGAEEILDPDMDREIQFYEERRARIG